MTGRPGIGKTTVFIRVVETIKRQGFTVGGIVCPEVRVGGVRTGFKIVDLMDGSQGWLAHVSSNCPHELTVGKYCVDVNDAVAIGVKALMKAISDADVLCIDEVGPMELRVRQLRDAIIHALKSPKDVLAVIHWRLSDPVVVELLKTAVKYEVTLDNRETLPNAITHKLLAGLERKQP